VESIQVIANILFQVLENGAYLSGKGILSWSKESQKAAWLWSSRFWGVHVFLDFVRLGKELLSRMENGEGEKGEGIFVKSGESSTEFWRRWRRQLVTDAAYAPLTVHWGMEGGVFGEEWVGVLGSVAGCAGLWEQWRKSGLEVS
jgi:hypothetical protein